LSEVYTQLLQLGDDKYNGDRRCMEMNINVSDWVHGRTSDGEMVYGFVESMDVLQGLVALHVVKSDNEERVGRSVRVRLATIKPVSDSASTDLRHADELIDLALATWDEEWFMELTTSNSGKERKRQKHEAIIQTAPPVNRLGKFIR
jgi:hypothetical protein